MTDSAANQSGLAETTRNIFLPLLQLFPDKYDLHQLGFFHFSPKEKIPWPIYQTKLVQTPQGPQIDMNDKWGEQSFHEVVNKVKPDIVFGYGDMWHFGHAINSPFRNTYRLITYYTIDGQPYFGSHLGSDDSTEWGVNLSKVDQVVSLSHFGRDVLKESCKELKDTNIRVMYHPIYTDLYKYVNSQQKLELKNKVLPKIIDKNKCFVAGFVGRNQFRKQNHKLWEITHYIVHGDYILCKDCDRVTPKEWNHSARRTKEPNGSQELYQLTLYDKDYDYSTCWYCKSSNVLNGTPDPNFYMWIHTSKKDAGYNREIHERMWKVTNNCLYTDPLDNGVNISKPHMLAIMGSFDCLIYPSGGEGFGNPAMESLALGVPVLYSDYSAHAEFCKHGGLPIRIGQYVPELGIGINRAVIDTGSAIRNILKIRHDSTYRESLGKSGHSYVQQFDVVHMARAWDMIFNDVYSKPLPINNNLIYATTI